MNMTVTGGQFITALSLAGLRISMNYGSQDSQCLVEIQVDHLLIPGQKDDQR
jgi:hypothetical protein